MNRTGHANLPLHGGKAASEIELACDRMSREPAPLVYASKTAAKVHSAAVQDGYTLYHHAFFFTGGGETRERAAQLACEKPSVVLSMPRHHDVRTADVNPRYLEKILVLSCRASVDRSEKVKAFRRLAEFTGRAHA